MWSEGQSKAPAQNKFVPRAKAPSEGPAQFFSFSTPVNGDAPDADGAHQQEAEHCRAEQSATETRGRPGNDQEKAAKDGVVHPRRADEQTDNDRNGRASPPPPRLRLSRPVQEHPQRHHDRRRTASLRPG